MRVPWTGKKSKRTAGYEKYIEEYFNEYEQGTVDQILDFIISKYGTMRPPRRRQIAHILSVMKYPGTRIGIRYERLTIYSKPGSDKA